MDDLAPLKQWVKGIAVRSEDAEPFVWYATADCPQAADSVFDLGHDVLVVVAEFGAYARIRFFSTFDLFVSFGPMPGVKSEAVLFSIDPLADHPPGDLVETPVQAPPALKLPRKDSDLVTNLRDRLQRLLSKVQTRQWTASTTGLLDSLNATRQLPTHERIDRVSDLLRPHRGHVLMLGRHVADHFRRLAADEPAELVADMLELMVAPDDSSHDGLTEMARVGLTIATAAVVDLIVSELAVRPLTDERLRLVLGGGPGAAAVASVLIDQIVGAGMAVRR